MQKIVVASLFLLVNCSLFGQQQITVMSYNVLNFPEGSMPSREDTLKKIINYVEPDLFLMQELKSETGLQLILNESFADLTGNYAASTFVVQQSNATNPNKLQQAIIYNTDVLGLADEGIIMTSVRDINRFRMFWNDPDLSNGADTVFLYVFVTHLKSSQGTANQEQRLEMAQSFASYQGYMPATAPTLFAGDLNLYNSTEPAYQELLDTTNKIPLLDPLDAPGNWHSSSFQPKNILTQSTRSSQIFGDGAGSGMDDRFDFVLLSENLFSAVNPVVYESGSYTALGNSGDCYNQSITDCSGAGVPFDILRAMYYMSDHLPVVLELNLQAGNVDVSEMQGQDPVLRFDGRGNLILDHAQNGDFEVQLFDTFGRVLFNKNISHVDGRSIIPIVMNDVPVGVYYIRATAKDLITTKKVIFGL